MTPAFLDNFHKIHPYWSSSAQDQKTTQKKYKTYLKGEKKRQKSSFSFFEDSKTPKPPANKKASGFQIVDLINTPVQQEFIHSAALAIQHILSIKADTTLSTHWHRHSWADSSLG